MESVRLNDWSKGANNIAQPSRLPEGAARRIINLDPTPSGTLELRPTFGLAVPGANVRAMFGLSDRLIFVDGGALRAASASGMVSDLADVDPAGDVVAAELNGRLYIKTLTASLVTDGESVRPWGMDAPHIDAMPIPGSLPAGVYKFAATVETQWGDESGGIVFTIALPSDSGLRVSLGSEWASLYMSTPNGHTLYLQREGVGLVDITSVADDTRPLVTGGMQRLPHVESLVALGSMLVGHTGTFVLNTEPMMPHLHDPVRGFVAMPAPVALLAPVSTGLFVSTVAHTFFVTGIGTAGVEMRKVADFPAQPGSYTPLPDGTAAWFSRYGQVIGAPDGTVRPLNQATFAPDLAPSGASGLLEFGGIQAVVTSSRGDQETNRLAVGDSWTLEVTDER